MAAMIKAQDVERVVVGVDAEEPVRYVIRINEYASNPAAKAEKDPKRKGADALKRITRIVKKSIMRHFPALPLYRKRFKI